MFALAKALGNEPPLPNMALMSRFQRENGHDKTASHPGFDNKWCRDLLSQPEIIPWKEHSYEGITASTISNSILEETMYNDRAVRAHLTFRRVCKESDAIRPHEECFLMSIGDGLDGRTGRGHGGLTSTLLDHICGHTSHYVDEDKPVATATATMTVDYLRPVNTPCLVLVRAWPVEHSGRKAWIKAVMEGEDGVYARATTLFILQRNDYKL